MLPQLLLPGFPEGSTRIGDILSILNKEGRVTYFVGSDNYFSHPVGDERSRRFILASLMENGHVRPCDLESEPLCIPHRTLMNWTSRLRNKGPDSFFRARSRQNPRVMTPENIANCASLFADGMSVSDVAKHTGIGESTIRKAVKRNAVKKKHQKEISETSSVPARQNRNVAM